jgi:hypothetical protein
MGGKINKKAFVRNYKLDVTQDVHEWLFDGPLCHSCLHQIRTKIILEIRNILTLIQNLKDPKACRYPIS